MNVGDGNFGSRVLESKSARVIQSICPNAPLVALLPSLQRGSSDIFRRIEQHDHPGISLES